MLPCSSPIIMKKGYRASRSGVAISATNAFGGKGMIVKVYDGKGYAEYSTNEITAENLPEIEREIEQQLMNPANFIPEGTEEAEYKCISDEPCTLCEATDYEIHPREVGDEKLIETVTALREKAVKADERILDAITGFNYQEYHKLFLSANRELEQSVLYSTGIMALVAAKGEEIKQSFRGFSNLGGAELLDKMESAIPQCVKTVTDLLNAEPMEPGTYECICTPEVTGMIVHEAFGHGVEMDMFVKDRALAQSYIGKQVASRSLPCTTAALSARLQPISLMMKAPCPTTLLSLTRAFLKQASAMHSPQCSLAPYPPATAGARAMSARRIRA